MNCRNEAKVSPTQSKDYAVPYVSRLRNGTFLTSNTNLDVYAKLLWEKEKKFVPLIFILLRNNQAIICSAKGCKRLNMYAA